MQYVNGNPTCVLCREKIKSIFSYDVLKEYVHFECDEWEEAVKRKARAEIAVDAAYEKNGFALLRCTVYH